jgi:hypothetical protein
MPLFCSWISCLHTGGYFQGSGADPSIKLRLNNHAFPCVGPHVSIANRNMHALIYLIWALVFTQVAFSRALALTRPSSLRLEQS